MKNVTGAISRMHRNDMIARAKHSTHACKIGGLRIYNPPQQFAGPAYGEPICQSRPSILLALPSDQLLHRTAIRLMKSEARFPDFTCHLPRFPREVRWRVAKSLHVLSQSPRSNQSAETWRASLYNMRVKFPRPVDQVIEYPHPKPRRAHQVIHGPFAARFSNYPVVIGERSANRLAQAEERPLMWKKSDRPAGIFDHHHTHVIPDVANRLGKLRGKIGTLKDFVFGLNRAPRVNQCLIQIVRGDQPIRRRSHQPQHR